MYNDYFRFRQSPFSIAPDPGFLYLSERHREALAHLMYGLKTDGGFVLITGEVGTGKTTLIRSVVEQVPRDLDIAFVLNPRLTVKELLETLCDELRVPIRSDQVLTVKHYIDHLNRHLLESHARGRSTVMVIDEAQNLPPAVLEQIRLLTNLETNERKLLRIILVGQPELDAVLARAEMRQLAQRITARCHLTALDRRETRAYVAHRLTLAGGHPSLFTGGALIELYRLSGGVPRLINIIADRALLGTYVENRQRVTRRIVRNAAREVHGDQRASTRWLAAAAFAVVLTAGATAWAVYESGWRPEPWRAERAALPAESATHASVTDDVAEAPPETASDDATPVGDAPEPFLIIGPDEVIRTADDWPELDTTTPASTTAPVETTEDGDRIIRPGARAEPVVAPQRAARIEQPVATETDDDIPTPVPRPPGMTTYRTLMRAYEVVFDHWGRPFDTGDVPCNVAPGVGLQCLRRSGGWQELVRINHPAVLEFRDAGGEPYFAALTGYDQHDAELHVGRQSLRVPISELEATWPGSYVVLWEMPPGYRGSIALGDEQPSVAWLRRQLSALMDVDLASPRPARFDDALDDALRAFQRHNGLAADGIAGPATWMQITSKVADVPLLDRRRPDVSSRDAAHDHADL